MFKCLRYNTLDGVKSPSLNGLVTWMSRVMIGENRQSRSKNPRAFWSAPIHGALEKSTSDSTSSFPEASWLLLLKFDNVVILMKGTRLLNLNKDMFRQLLCHCQFTDGIDHFTVVSLAT